MYDFDELGIYFSELDAELDQWFEDHAEDWPDDLWDD